MRDVSGLCVRHIGLAARFGLARIVQAADTKDKFTSFIPSRAVYLRGWYPVLCN